MGETWESRLIENLALMATALRVTFSMGQASIRG